MGGIKFNAIKVPTYFRKRCVSKSELCGDPNLAVWSKLTFVQGELNRESAYTNECKRRFLITISYFYSELK
jgi:hypothetical protein